MCDTQRGTQLHLCDVGDADDEGDKADNEDEDLLPLPQHQGIFIQQSCDEAFHCAELRHPTFKRDPGKIVLQFFIKRTPQ